jgi:hypothetical protein
MTDLYFNGRSWRQLGLTDQDVKFLERLATALQALETSATTDSSTVSTLTATLTALQTTVSGLESDVDAIDTTTAEQEVISLSGLNVEVKRMQRRITELENAL